MNISDYGMNMFNGFMSNIKNVTKENNQNASSAYDYIYDSTKKGGNNNMIYSGGLQHLSTMLQHLFFRISDNQTTYNKSATLGLSAHLSDMLLSPSSSFKSSLTPSLNEANPYRYLSLISFWFVLILNPILILFGTIGNLLTIYILITCNIVALPVSFYAIMLNISDSLNLLIPILIFWLDNCINRTPERGYFRDKSNFLCKALMCPDQLFAALSAWYMCAISFNRWYSVYRPSSFFMHTSSNVSKGLSGSSKNHLNSVNRRHKSDKSESCITAKLSSSSSFSSTLDCRHCFSQNTKYRQQLQPFRCIAIITLLGILCCLYPILMHELRSVRSTNRNLSYTKEKHTLGNAATWKRCYYSQKHEHVYDIIGIILSVFLHILPLTFVGIMNIMIIIKLRKRQNLTSISTNTPQSLLSTNKNKILVNYSQNYVRYALTHSPSGNNEKTIVAEVDSTIADVSSCLTRIKRTQTAVKNKNNAQKRHYSRDRTITIMLVSIALTYLVLTIPYRLFWSYNVYIKRMFPEKLNSPVYLLKMHHIDHVLRTIRNMHYCTNCVFFILLSKAFRLQFRQLLIENLLPRSMQTYNTDTNIYSEITNHKCTMHPLKRQPLKLETQTKNIENETIINNDILCGIQSAIEDSCLKSSYLPIDVSQKSNKKHSITETDHENMLRESE